MTAPLASMTAFASRTGLNDPASWAWDIRSVNNRGLDLRLRLPEGIEGLEAAVRAEISRRIARGSVSLTLKLARGGEGEGMRIVPAGLAAALAALAQVEEAAQAAGMPLAPMTAAEVLCLRGVTETATAGDAAGDAATTLRATLLADLAPLLDAFCAMRQAEGAALGAILMAQLDTIAAQTATARTEAAARHDQWAASLQEALRKVHDAAGLDPARVAQELALIAVKADVTEELDRLEAHVTAARDLVRHGGPVGRKLDFLTQEFLREANTLCSKAQSAGLTRIGLDLKAVIEQMREQVQNLE